MMNISDELLRCVNTARTKEAAGGGFDRFQIAVFSGSMSDAVSLRTEGQIFRLHCLRETEKNHVPPAGNS